MSSYFVVLKHVFTEENDNKDLLERIRRLEEKTDKKQQKAEKEEKKMSWMGRFTALS